jgi:2-dehydropantoate 2-reductase
MKVGILGAGAIGCYVGLRLLHTNVDVVLVGRQSLLTSVSDGNGSMTAESLTGFTATMPTPPSIATTDINVLAHCDIIIVALKVGATTGAGTELAAVLRSSGRSNPALVFTFQNGNIM